MVKQGRLIRDFDIEEPQDKQVGLIYREVDNDKLLNFIKPTDVVLDLGGHIGSFALAASRLCRRVYVYEPNHINFGYLERNIRVNGIENVVLYNSGVDVFDGPGDLGLDPDRSMNATLYKKRTTPGSDIVDIEDFEKVMNRHRDVNIIKMDIEGSEYFIIRKYIELIEERIDYIGVEFHLDNIGEKTVEHSKREDVSKWFEFIGLLTRRFEIVKQRQKDTVRYIDDWGKNREHLRNGIDFVTLRQNR